MKAEVKNIESPDILNLKEYWPEDETSFSFYLELSVGISSQEGEEIFGITVCTPKWLLENHRTDEVLFLRHYLLVFEYNYNRITEELKKKIQNLSAGSWNELALKVSKIGYWEFEDYQE